MFSFNQETFYTPEQVARKLQLSLTTVYQLIKSNRIPALRLGKSFRIVESELAQLWEERPGETFPLTALRFIERLKDAPFRNKIVDVILFGSWAKGEAGQLSDIDLLLIHGDLTPEERKTVVRMETDSMEATGFKDELSVLRKSVEQWEFLKKIGAALYRNVTEQGISLWKNPPMNRRFSNKEP